jgi:hypothetical protein
LKSIRTIQPPARRMRQQSTSPNQFKKSSLTLG